MIQMFSSQEYSFFGMVFFSLIVIVVLTYLLFNFIVSLITDRIYYHYKKKAIKQLRKALRQCRIEHEELYVHDIEMLYNAIKEGESEVE